MASADARALAVGEADPAHAVALLERAGVGALEVDSACTACAGLLDPDRPGFGDYFSHTRDLEGTRQRNLVLVAPAG